MSSIVANTVFDIINSWNSASNFVNDLFTLISTFASFLFNFVKNISSYFDALTMFLRVYVVELPITLISIFGELPVFVQTGLTVVLYGLYIAFIFRVIKLIIPFL